MLIKIKLIFFIFLLGNILFSNPIDFLKQNKIIEIKDQDAKGIMLTNWDNSNFYLLDVRTLKEYEEYNLNFPRIMLLDYYHSTFAKQLFRLPTNRIYFLYCHSGYRSRQTIQKLKKQQVIFNKLYHLKTGLKKIKLKQFKFLK